MRNGFKVRAVLAALAVVGLAACNFNVTNAGGNEALNAEATAFYGKMVLHQEDAVMAEMSERVNEAELRAQLPFLYTLIPESPPPEPEVKGNQSYAGTDGRTYSVLQDYAYEDRVNHVATRFIHEGDGWKVLMFNVNVTMKAAQDPDDLVVVAPSVDGAKT